MSHERLLTILQTGTEQECVEFFSGMPEKERREYFQKVKAVWKQAKTNRVVETEPGRLEWNGSMDVARTAYFATASFSEIRQAKWLGRPNDDDVLFALLRERRPDWIDQWIDTLLSGSHYWMHWGLIRRLMAAGLARKPDSPKYYLGMVGYLASHRNKIPLEEALLESPDLLEHDIWKLFEHDGEGENSLANTERFRASWSKTFIAFMQQGKLPRAKLLQCTLEALERDFNHYRARWFYEFYDALEPTEAELRQHAERFLGLLRATAPNVASWALAKVEHLAKSDCYASEALSHALEPILQARAKGTVLQALKLLELQAAAQPEQRSVLATSAVTALSHEKTDVQNATIAFLEKFASPDDAPIRQTVEKYASSLSASVRGRVTKWLAQGEMQQAASAASTSSPSKSSASQALKKQDGRPSPTARNQKTKAAGKATANVPDALQSLLAIDAIEQSLNEDVLSIPASKFDGTEIARLAHLRKLEPIDDLEELIDVCARVIEDGSLVDDVERSIDGMARLCGSKPENFEQLTGPLLKRVRQLIKKGCSPFLGLDPGNDILGLFYSFCTGQVIEPVKSSQSKYASRGLQYQFEGEMLEEYDANLAKPIGFLSLRSRDVARRIARSEASQPLSVPTHEQGWIDPRELALRVNAWTGDAPDTTDVVLAMLRLAPDHREAALKSLQPNSSEWAQAIRYALGDDKPIGNQAPLWVAAARARAPWQDDGRVLKKFPDLGPDAGTAAKIAFVFKSRTSHGHTFVDADVQTTPAVPKNIDPLLVTVTMHPYRARGNMLMFELGGFGGKTNGAVRWTSMIWPLARESYFAGCAQDCLNNLDWSEAQWQNRTMLEPLLDSATPLRHAGLILLIGMLAAKEPGESGLATDIAIRAIEDSRLGSDNLGAALSELLISGLIKPGRWQKTLTEVARASQLHAAVIQIALQHCFSKTSARKLPKDAAKLLELLNELSVELGLTITNATCRDYLETSATSGKAAKLAKSLLKLEASDQTRATITAVLESALEQRIAAANRLAFA